MARYDVNEAAVAKARSLIAGRQYVLDSDWGDVQPSAEAADAFLDRHSWDDYGAWHLGLTVDANPEAKARHAFVYGDFRRIHRTALIAARGLDHEPDNGRPRRLADPRSAPVSCAWPP